MLTDHTLKDRFGNGFLQEFNGDDFTVGIWFFKTTFDVSEPPHEVEGTWQMVVDGVRLKRIDAWGD